MQTLKKISLNVTLLLFSVILGLLLCEGLLRLLKDKTDAFPVDPIPDPVLGMRLQPFQSFHDARGFRNKTVPGDHPIVCIGDSFIYGYGLPLKDAIPSQLSLMLDKTVYSMALPAYGPVQYYQLYQDSRELHPQATIIALYIGNDVLDAYFRVKGGTYWQWLYSEIEDDQSLSTLSFCSLPIDRDKIDVEFLNPERVSFDLRKPGSIIWMIHSYFRLHSSLYASVFEGIVKPLVQKHVQLPGVFHAPSIDMVFVPGGDLRHLDLHEPQVRQGLLITRKIIELLCQENKDQPLIFTIIPTKENVYYEFLKNHNTVLPNEYECAVYYEKEVTEWLMKVVENNGGIFVNVFRPLAMAASNGAIVYNQLSDCHLNRVGSQIVATALDKALRIHLQIAHNMEWSHRRTR